MLKSRDPPNELPGEGTTSELCEFEIGYEGTPCQEENDKNVKDQPFGDMGKPWRCPLGICPLGYTCVG